MFKKQLSVNIKELDEQIAGLNEELKNWDKDSSYDSTMDKLKTLVELRKTLAESLKGNESSEAITEMDAQIKALTKEIHSLERDDAYCDKLAKLDELTRIRCELAESQTNGSIKNVVVSGVLGIASVAIVLKYEEKDVITSKAFSMIPSVFRGSK